MGIGESLMSKKIMTSALGLVLVLGWWTFRDKFFGGTNASAASDRIPAKVWEGGNALTIEVESSDPGVLRAYFAATARNSGTPVRSLDTYEKVPAGSHAWRVDVPDAVGGDLEFQADNPKPGSRIRWTVRSGSRTLAQDSETLNAPLQANEAFLLKYDGDDFATADSAE
jgi:hypothetical protein